MTSLKNLLIMRFLPTCLYYTIWAKVGNPNRSPVFMIGEGFGFILYFD